MNSWRSPTLSSAQLDFYRYADNASLERCISIEDVPADDDDGRRKQLNSSSPSRKNTKKKENHRRDAATKRATSSWGEWAESRERLAYILMLLLSL